MNVLNLLDAPWAILPEKLLELQAVYARHLRGEATDIAAVEARIGKPLKNESRGYSVQDGVAVFPLEGIIAKRANLFTQISGGVSTQLAQRDLAAALNDPSVHSIILLIDSPGGEVDGTQALAEMVFAARGKMPITALIDGIGASAAYWIASAADRVLITGDTVATGSIGVVAAHYDYSQRDAKEGVKVSEISAGKYKRIASAHEPLTEEGRSSIQQQVDAIHSVFVDTVARNRGVSASAIAGTEARLFIGKQAINAGLVDGVSTLDKLIADLGKQHGSASVTASAAAAAKPPAEKSMRERLEEVSARARRRPWGQSAEVHKQIVEPAAKVEPAPLDSAEVSREARDLQGECVHYAIPITAGDAVDHVVARRTGSMNQQQIARAAQIERARLATRGIAVSTAEAVQRALQQHKRAEVLL
jgi:signal peptide peptidase SppA